MFEASSLQVPILFKEFAKRSTIQKWVTRAIFQFVFGSLLSLILTGLIWLEIATLDPFKPRVRQSASFVNPALGFRPIPKDPYSTLIHFKHGNNDGTWKPLEVNLVMHNVEHID